MSPIRVEQLKNGLGSAIQLPPSYIKTSPPPVWVKPPVGLYVGLGVLGAAVVGGIVWYARR